MFGLIMGIALGIGGIAAGIKRSKNLNDVKNWSIGRKNTNTYYDYYKGTDRDIITDKPVDIVTANNGTNHTLVVDRSSGRVLRNASLDDKHREFRYGQDHLGQYICESKAMLQYTAREINDILNYQCVHLEKCSNFSQNDKYLNVYRHFKTGKLCLRKYMDQESLEILKKEIKIFNYGAEVIIDREKECCVYYDIITGEPLDVEFPGRVIIKYFSKMENIVKETNASIKDINSCIFSYRLDCKRKNILYLTSLSEAFDKISIIGLV